MMISSPAAREYSFRMIVAPRFGSGNPATMNGALSHAIKWSRHLLISHVIHAR